jgi:hypothetical protein
MKWKKFQREIEKYAEEHDGSMDVPQAFVTEEGYTLGLKVSRVRRGTLGRHDEARMAWRTERGFVRNVYAEAVSRSWCVI